MSCTIPTPKARRHLHSFTALAALATVVICYPHDGQAELRPLVRDMLENLGAINDIGYAVALDDYEQVERAARDLKLRAAELRKVDIETLGFAAVRDPAFDRFLSDQETAATTILSAATKRDGDTVLLGVRRMMSGPCIGCHAAFREPESRLSPAVLFMTSFIAAWREMNRGIAINDFNLVAEHARAISAIGQVITWDQVIGSTFDLDETEELQTFRGYAKKVLQQAKRIEQASIEEDAGTVIEASYRMWSEGCIACHQRFR